MLLRNIFYSLLACLFFSTSAISQACFELVQNDSGMDWASDEMLEQKACALRTALDVSGFKVYGADLYPILAYVNEEEGFQYAYDLVQGNLNNPDGYIFFSREKRSDQTLNYRLHIDYPDNSTIDEWDEVMRDAVESELLAVLMEFGQGELSVQGEIKAIEAFINILNNGINAGKFELAGFSEVKLSNESSITRGQPKPNETYANLTIHNYDGHHIDGQEIGSIFAGLSQSTRVSNFSYAIFITGDETAQDQANFDQIYQDFRNDPAKIKIWMHFDFTTEQIVTLNDSDGNKKSQSKQTNNGSLYLLTDNNLTQEECTDDLNTQYEQYWDVSTYHNESENLTPDPNQASCGLDWQFGKKCLYNNAHEVFSEFGFMGDQMTAEVAFIAGFVDGFLGTLNFLYTSGDLIGSFLSNPNNLSDAVLILANPTSVISVLLARSLGYESYIRMLSETISNPRAYAKRVFNTVHETVSSITQFIDGEFSFSIDPVKAIAMQLWESGVSYFNNQFNGSVIDIVAYGIGIIAFEVLLDAVTFGGNLAVTGAKITKFGLTVGNRGRAIAKATSEKLAKGKTLVSESRALLASANKQGLFRMIRCDIFRRGCFVKDTQVLIANKNYLSKSRNLTLAANIPLITAVPIQDVQLLDYAIAYKTVNEQNNLIASTDIEIYLELNADVDLNIQDPYTSDQQIERDKYELNDTDWYSVSFEQVYGTSNCQFALHDDWIQHQGYEINKIVNLDIPEQGISGPFRITSVKHILPQKRPETDPNEDYTWKPVTGLFEHNSDNVYEISFDNGEKLGVTNQHPVYSITAGDWKLAGELEVGEKVLTYKGAAAVTVSSIKDGIETVYNLEVKELHNFLVGESGILVHNACWRTIRNALDRAKTSVDDLKMIIKDGWDKGVDWNPIDGGRATGYFGRGRFFEGLLWKGKYKKKGYKYTGKDDLGEGLGVSNYPVVDVYKGSTATSIKTTRNSNPWSWINQKSANNLEYNKKHLDDIISGMDQGPGNPGKFGTHADLQNVQKFELDVYVRDFDTPQANVQQWQRMVDEYLVSKNQQDLVGKIKVSLAKVEDSF